VGDRVSLGALAQPATAPGSDGGISVIYNATNTYISTPGTIPLIPDKLGTLNMILPTAAKWKVVAIPYKLT